MILAETPQAWPWVVGGILVVFGLIILSLIGRFVKLWIQAYFARANITMFDLIGMSLRKVDLRVIVLSKIRASQSGLNLTTGEMESHYLSGGRVPNVITALIAANRANIALDWRLATAIDLAGRDILDAVQTSVNPRVIDCPNPATGKTTIDAVAKDGIQLKAKARVTVRANIDRLVGLEFGADVVADVNVGDVDREDLEGRPGVQALLQHLL